MQIIVIASTNGGVLSKLLNVNYFKEKISCVVSDRECGALRTAKEAGIKTKILRASTGKNSPITL